MQKKKKMRLGKKIPYLFRISWKFLSKSWSNRLDGPCGSFSQVMEQFSGLSKPISPTYFLIGFHRNWVWRPTTCLKMLLKMVQNCSIAPIFDGFWRVLLPWDARNNICLALICQNMGFIPGRFWLCNFCVFRFLFQTFLKISQHLLVFWKKL